MGHIGSYVWELRQKVGSRQLLLPGAQVLVLGAHGTALFQRRVDNGVWELPAGACEPGQSFADTAVAELFEETGILANSADLIAFASLSEPELHQLEYRNGDKVHAFALCFVLERWQGNVLPEKSKVSEIAFFPLTPQGLEGAPIDLGSTLLKTNDPRAHVAMASIKLMRSRRSV